MDELVLAVQGLSKRIGTRPVLSDVSFELHSGRGLSVMGGNGAGKSTLLRILAGVLGYDAGTLIRFGERVSREGAADARVGYLGHRSLLYPHLTLDENLRLYGRLWAMDHLDDRIRRVVSQVGLSWSCHDPLKTYSRGMMQRAALARVMLAYPVLWLLDEPYSGLDGDGRAVLSDVLQEALRRGCAFVMTTHALGEACRDAEVVAMLEQGRFSRWAHTESLGAGWTTETAGGRGMR